MRHRMSINLWKRKLKASSSTSWIKVPSSSSHPSYFYYYLVKLSLLHLLSATFLMIGLATLMTWQKPQAEWQPGSIASRYHIGDLMKSLKVVDDCMLIGSDDNIECGDILKDAYAYVNNSSLGVN